MDARWESSLQPSKQQPALPGAGDVVGTSPPWSIITQHLPGSGHAQVSFCSSLREGFCTAQDLPLQALHSRESPTLGSELLSTALCWSSFWRQQEESSCTNPAKDNPSLQCSAVLERPQLHAGTKDRLGLTWLQKEPRGWR